MGVDVLGPVPSVAAALALLAAGTPPDATILDVKLGGEMAFPVAEALRARRIPFMFTTGYDPSSPLTRSSGPMGGEIRGSADGQGKAIQRSHGVAGPYGGAHGSRTRKCVGASSRGMLVSDFEGLRWPSLLF